MNRKKLSLEVSDWQFITEIDRQSRNEKDNESSYLNRTLRLAGMSVINEWCETAYTEFEISEYSDMENIDISSNMNKDRALGVLSFLEKGDANKENANCASVCVCSDFFSDLFRILLHNNNEDSRQIFVSLAVSGVGIEPSLVGSIWNTDVDLAVEKVELFYRFSKSSND